MDNKEISKNTEHLDNVENNKENRNLNLKNKFTKNKTFPHIFI